MLKAISHLHRNIILLSMIGILTSAMPARGNSDTVRSLTVRGERALEEKEFRQATGFFREALQKNPEYETANIGMARAYVALGDPGEAQLYYERAIQNNSGNLEALIGLGRVHTLLGNRDRAGQYLRKALEMDPSSAKAIFFTGKYYENFGYSDIARQYYEKNIRIEPNNIESRLSLAKIYAARGEFSRALDQVEQSTRIDAINPEIHLVMGEIYLQHYRSDSNSMDKESYLEKAKESFHKANQLSASKTGAFSRLALAELYNNKPRSAIEYLKEINKQNPGDIKVKHMLAALMFVHQNMASDLEIIKYYNEVIGSVPNDSISRFALEDLVINSSSPVPPELRTQLLDFHRDMLVHYKNRGSYDRMIYHLRRGLMIAPEDKQLLEERMDIHRRHGDYELFLEDLILLNKLKPDDQSVRYRLERAIKNRFKALPFETGITLNNTFSAKGKYRRTPVKVLVFDFKPKDSLFEHPDGSDVLSRALIFHMNNGSCSEALAGENRDVLLSEFRKASGDNHSLRGGAFFKPEELNIVEQWEEKSGQRLPYIIEGSYSTSLHRIDVSYTLTDKKTNQIVGKFQFSGSGKEAIHSISSRAAGVIRTLIPCEGRVVASNPDGILVNLGKVDGLKKEMILQVMRNGNPYEKLKLVSVDSRLSRAVPLDKDWYEIGKDSTVVIDRTETTGVTTPGRAK